MMNRTPVPRVDLSLEVMWPTDRDFLHLGGPVDILPIVICILPLWKSISRPRFVWLNGSTTYPEVQVPTLGISLDGSLLCTLFFWLPTSRPLIVSAVVCIVGMYSRHTCSLHIHCHVMGPNPMASGLGCLPPSVSHMVWEVPLQSILPMM